MLCGISLYPQGTLIAPCESPVALRYIPVPTGNASCNHMKHSANPVYPCTHRERISTPNLSLIPFGISLYPQGTPSIIMPCDLPVRYIPVPTGNAFFKTKFAAPKTVYPCTHRERSTVFIFHYFYNGISLYPQGTHEQSINNTMNTRYIPVPTGNAESTGITVNAQTVYPCTHRERLVAGLPLQLLIGISLYPQGTLEI